jgi:hypothetical protein
MRILFFPLIITIKTIPHNLLKINKTEVEHRCCLRSGLLKIIANLTINNMIKIQDEL